MYRAARLLLITSLLAGVAAALSYATQVAYQSPEQLGRQSALVVQGKVLGVRSFWNEGKTKIFTETEIGVDNAFKGEAPPTVRVLQLGGVVDNVRVTVHGALQWKPGEEVLLFLEAYDAGSYAVSGFSQGRFDIERDAQGRPFVTRPALEGLELVGAPSEITAQRASQTSAVPLERFINQALGRNR